MLLQQLCIVMGSACMVQALVNYVDPDLRMPLHTLAPGAAMAMVGIYGWRVFFSSYLLKRVGRRPPAAGRKQSPAGGCGRAHSHTPGDGRQRHRPRQ